MKVQKRCVRRDSLSADHIHSLPRGGNTQGQLLKPSQSTQFPMHTHLYEHDGKILETNPSEEGPGHTHDTIIGLTAGPKPFPPKESYGPRNDSMLRIGSEWHIRNENGVTLSKGKTPEEAASRYDSEDTYDETFAKQAAGVQDGDENWEKAKAHSMTNFSTHKWPYIQHVHKVLSNA